jgi:hypothetical protein
MKGRSFNVVEILLPTIDLPDSIIFLKIWVICRQLDQILKKWPYHFFNPPLYHSQKNFWKKPKFDWTVFWVKMSTSPNVHLIFSVFIRTLVSAKITLKWQNNLSSKNKDKFFIRVLNSNWDVFDFPSSLLLLPPWSLTCIIETIELVFSFNSSVEIQNDFFRFFYNLDLS